MSVETMPCGMPCSSIVRANDKMMKSKILTVSLVLTAPSRQQEKSPYAVLRKGISSLGWRHQESNRGHKDFQSFALPTELWHQRANFRFAGAKVGQFSETTKHLPQKVSKKSPFSLWQRLSGTCLSVFAQGIPSLCLQFKLVAVAGNQGTSQSVLGDVADDLYVLHL